MKRLSLLVWLELTLVDDDIACLLKRMNVKTVRLGLSQVQRGCLITLKRGLSL